MANAAATTRSEPKNATSQGYSSVSFNRPTGSGIAFRSSRLLAAASSKPTTSSYTPRSSLASKFAARDTNKPSTSSYGTNKDYGSASRSISESTRPSSRASTLSISFTNKLPESPRKATGTLTTNFKSSDPLSSSRIGTTSTSRTIVGSSASDYLRSRRKPDDISSSTNPRSLTTKSAGVPEVISRFGSRSPAFLAGGVVRASAPSYSTRSGRLSSTVSPTGTAKTNTNFRSTTSTSYGSGTNYTTGTTRKEERPWRVRMAESSRLRNLDAPTISFTTAGGATSIVTRTRPTNTEIAKTAVKESTPVSSIGLRNYESKFCNRYSASPVSSIASSYSPTRYRHSVPVGRLSRNSSTASSTLSLLSQVTSPRYLSPTFGHGTVGTARANSAMTRSLYTPTSFTSTYRPSSRMTQSYTASDFKRMGEGTKWTPVEPKPIVEERMSRDPEKTPKPRSRSVSKKRRSRSRSVANEPPPATSSDSEGEKGKPMRRKKLRRKPSATNLAPTFATKTTPKPVSNQKTKVKMPANFEGSVQNSLNDKPETITAKTVPLVQADAPNKTNGEFHAVTTFKPATVLKKKKVLEETSNKPVPGSWNNDNEVNISCNKSLIRKEPKVHIEIVMKHIPHAKAANAYFKAQKKKRIVVMSRNKIVNATFMKPKMHNQTALITLKDKHAVQKSVAKLSLKEPKKAIKSVEKNINEHIVKNKQMKLNVEKKWVEKKRTITQKATLRCKAIGEKVKTVNMNIHRKPEEKSCNGTVRLPAVKTSASAKLTVSIPMTIDVILAQPPKILSPERIEWSDGFSSPELYERELHIPLPPQHQAGGPLVLPDRSILEEYVRRKRNHLETIRTYNSPVDGIHESEIAAQRADSNMTPRPNDPVQVQAPPKITTAAPAAPANLLKAMLRKTSDPTGANRLQPMKAVFDAPKSPFEEKMQQQANRLRQTDENEPKTDNKWKRRSMDSDLAQGFQAQAAQHSNKPAERYAAHIPINVPSGRQSATSMESVQSVALDKASHKLDQMIDQARYKHQQHRTKFKEAIDYLDQIFEDLKKETVEPQNRPEKQKPDKFPVKITKTMTKGTTSPQRPQLVKSVSQDAGGNARIHPQKQLQPARFQQPISQAQKPVQHAVNAQFKGQREKPQKVESGDVEVTETIVLPSKNTSERLDYTRKWLQDDIKTWVDKPGNVNNQLRRVGSSGESDEEHSLGSCSAEVAFINAAKREKREKQPAKEKKTKTEPVPQPPPQIPQIQQPVTQNPPNMGAPIKPRPYRPNEQGAPGFVITDDQNPYNNIRPSTSDSVDRAASEFSHGSQNSHELKNCEKVLFSAEKVTFNSLQRSNSGAFVQFQRGSIQSLPDAMYGPTRTPLPYPPSNTSGYGSTSSQQYLHPPDPVHQMNALVAELELSNDPNFEKRRSFPIMPNDPQKSSPRQRPIANTTVKVQDPQSVPRLSVPQQHNYSGSMDRGMRRYEEKMAVQRPVDKSNVLAQKMGQKVVPNSEVVPKMVPNQKMVPKMAPKQKLEDAASLLDSVIGELHPLDAPKRPKATEHYAQNTVSQTTVPTWQQQMMAKKQQRIAQTGPGISGAPVMGQAYLQDPSVHQQVQYGTQHSTSIQHGTQVGVGLQHGTQVGTGLQHGTQVGTGLQHGTQHSTALQHGTQHAPSYTQQSNQYLQQPQHNPPHNSPRNQPVGVVHVHQHQHGQQAQLPNHFQIINDEKLNPSKVEAIHNIFDRKPIQRQGSREKVQRQRSSDQLQHQVQHRDLSQSGRDLDIVLHPPEPVYSEINEFRKDRSGSLKNPSRVQFDSRPSLPSTQPPNHRTYLSPTQKPVQRQGSLRTPHQYDKPQAQYEKPQAQYDRASLNSQNVDEEENFYDNIRTHCSDAHRQEDEHSVTSRRTIGAPYQTSRSPQPPMPKNAGRIGQLIRKLGGVPERPIVHQNSLHDNHGASVLSLNRVGQDGAQRPGMLMKSNSLSHEPWRIHAIEKDDSSMDQKTSGIGNRLKQTLFGSRKWHNN